MINKLPRWVWLGGGLLAFVGGMVNVVGLLSVGRVPVSHMSGNTSELGIAIIDHEPELFVRLAMVIGSFLAGAILSGWLIQSSTLQLGRRYSTALCVETALLCVAIGFLQRGSIIGLSLCATACGLQNALASTYSGAIVRTTHVTGVYTDLGILLGQFLRGQSLDRRKLSLYVLILGGFCLGGMAGALLLPHIGFFTLLVPAVITGLTAVAYEIYRINRADVRSSSPA